MSDNYQRTAVSRRRFLASSAGIAGAVMLPACGDDPETSRSGSSDRPIEIDFMNWVAAEEATAENVDKVLTAFSEEHAGVEVRSVPVPFDQMRQQLLTSFAGGNPADSVMLSHSWPFELGPSGGLFDLRELADEGYLEDNFSGPALEGGEYEGTLYALPVSNGAHGFWRHKGLMEEAGLDPNNPPETLADLDDQMAELKAALGDDIFPLALPITEESTSLTHFWIWLRTFGAMPLYDGQINFDTPEVGDTLDWLRNLANKGYTPVGQRIQEERELMARERIVFRTDGPFWIGISQSLNPDLEGDAFHDTFEVGAMPVGPVGEPVTITNLHQAGVATEADDPQAAWEFIQFFATSDVSVTEYQLPQGVIPEFLPAATSEEVTADPARRAFVEEVIPTMVKAPFSPDYGQAQEPIINAMQEAAITDKPISTILAETEAALQQALGAS